MSLSLVALPPVRPLGRRRQPPVRIDIMRAVASGTSALLRRITSDSDLAAPLQTIVQLTVGGLEEACWNPGGVYVRDCTIYRSCGRTCARTGISEEEAVGAMDGAAEAFRDDLLVPAALGFDAKYGTRAVDRASALLCGVVDGFTRDAYRELRHGFAEVTAQ